MEKVKKLIEAGASIPTAIKEALGITVAVFADKYEIARPAVSDLINGNRRPTDTQIAALIAELGGTPDEWRALLWEAGKPDSVSAA